LALTGTVANLTCGSYVDELMRINDITMKTFYAICSTREKKAPRIAIHLTRHAAVRTNDGDGALTLMTVHRFGGRSDVQRARSACAG
jgi:hypothetical protein